MASPLRLLLTLTLVVTAWFGCGPEPDDMRGYLLLTDQIIEGDSTLIATVRLERRVGSLWSEETRTVSDAIVTANGMAMPFVASKGAYQRDLDDAAVDVEIEIEDHAERYSVRVPFARMELDGFPPRGDALDDPRIELEWDPLELPSPGWLEVFRVDASDGELVQSRPPLVYTIPEDLRGGELNVFYYYRDDLVPPGPPFEEVTYSFTERVRFTVP